tara:strand:- start:16 stop:354 length:339 start_codon:yes stop_codon:yes gene_type:complete
MGDTNMNDNQWDAQENLEQRRREEESRPEKPVANPFRNAEMRRLFDGYVAMFYDGKLRNPNGTPSHGGSTRCMFWRGYDGIPDRMGLALTGHGTIGYAAFRAGQAVKKSESE